MVNFQIPNSEVRRRIRKCPLGPDEEQYKLLLIETMVQ